MGKEYFWLKINYPQKQNYKLAYKELGSRHYVIVETNETYSEHQVKNVHRIQVPKDSIKQSITKIEIDNIISFLKKHGIINNSYGTGSGVYYAMGWYVKNYAFEYKIKLSNINNNDIYYLGFGSWDEIPEKRSIQSVKSHILEYCNDKIFEHNKISDNELNIYKIWGVI